MSPSLANLAVLALALAALASCGKAWDEERWNVLLVTLDTTRADALSCYGAEGETPALDALAAEGARFDLAMSTAAVTPVSHASILTGLYNHRHGLRVIYAGSGYRLDGAIPTLATVLAEHGYRTAAVHSAFPVSRFFGFERGFAAFDDVSAEMAERDGEFGWDVSVFQRRSDETTARALAALSGEPFFLWVHYWDPHDVAKLPPGLRLRDARSLDLPPGMQPFYQREVSYMDGEIGRLLAELRARGLDERTLVVVVADHGQGLLDHGWPGHRLLYQEQIRVPLIVRVPGGRGGLEVPELVRTVDVFPTVLDYLGIALPATVSGRSLRPLIEGQADEPRLALADQINGYDWNAGMVRERPLDDFLYLAMDREWKLIYRPLHFDESELYHLRQDPREEHDLFSRDSEAARVLLEVLAREAPWVDGAFAEAESLQDGARQALDELGYTGTTPVDARWGWTCPRHLEQRWMERGPCPECGGPPLLVGR